MHVWDAMLRDEGTNVIRQTSRLTALAGGTPATATDADAPSFATGRA